MSIASENDSEIEENQMFLDITFDNEILYGIESFFEGISII